MGISGLTPLLVNMGFRGAGLIAVKAGMGAVAGQQTAIAQLAIDKPPHVAHEAAKIPAAMAVNTAAGVIPGGDIFKGGARAAGAGLGLDIAESLVSEAASDFAADAINQVAETFRRTVSAA